MKKYKSGFTEPPQHYFENLESRIMDNAGVNAEPAKVIPISPVRTANPWIFKFSVAASIVAILGFALFLFDPYSTDSDDGQEAIASIENVSEEELQYYLLNGIDLRYEEILMEATDEEATILLAAEEEAYADIELYDLPLIL